jgi:hypothetical protein
LSLDIWDDQSIISNANVRVVSLFGTPKGQSPLSREEFGHRLTKAVALAGRGDAILIRDQAVNMVDLTERAPNLSVQLLKSFADASTDENFWIYRVNLKQPATPH